MPYMVHPNPCHNEKHHKIPTPILIPILILILPPSRLVRLIKILHNFQHQHDIKVKFPDQIKMDIGN